MSSNKKHHHHNVYSIDYYASNSGLKNVNDTLKVLISMITIILCLSFNNIIVSVFVMITMGAVTVVKGKIPFSHYFGFMLIPVSFVFLSGIAIAVNFSIAPIESTSIKIAFFYAYLNENSVMTALKVSSKALGCISALYMLTFSTTAGELISVLKKAGLPKIFISIMDMIYRFIFILSDQVNSMNVSAKSRIGYEGFISSLKTFGMISGNLFIVSLKKAGITYDAMLSRCYDSELCFLREEKKVTKFQVLIVLIYIGALVFLHILTV